MYFITEGTNKNASGRKNIYETDTINFNMIQIGEVVSISDSTDMGRIKVRIKGPRNRGGDDGIADADLPWCFPLMAKFFTGQPKLKEAVFVFVFNKAKEFQDRMYLGPIISQPQQLNNDPLYMTALRGFSFASQSPDTSPSTIPQLKGVFPNQEDVSIQGRYNTDIIQKTNEVVIRAGKFEVSTPDNSNPFKFRFNTKTQGYIQIKNDAVIQAKTDSAAEFKGTITNIVANKINLLTHKDGNPRFDLTNQDNLISDEEMAKILESAHQLVFGDILLEYLRLFKEALFNHVHNGSGNPATDLTASGNKQALAEFKRRADDLEKAMLSKNIRIN